MVERLKNTIDKCPELLSEWHPTKNYALQPYDVTMGSGNKIWWQCPKLHEWLASPNGRTGHGFRGCPFCSGRVATAENNLVACYPELAKEWHPVKNGDITPSMRTPKSNQHAWWLGECGHEWKSAISTRSHLGCGCPYCGGSKADKYSSLAFNFHDLIKEWHPTKNVHLHPSKLTCSSGKIVWWKCKQGDDHEWRARVSDRTGRNTGCPFCSGRFPSSDNNLGVLRPDLAKGWHPTKNGIVTPHGVAVRSSKSAWWICPRGHEWKAVISNRSIAGCPACSASKGEKQIAECLDTQNLTYQREYRIDDCRSLLPLPFDFALFDAGLLTGLIEYHGRQHFEPIPWFGGKKSFESLVVRDAIKQRYCNGHGIDLLVIPYTAYAKIEDLVQNFIASTTPNALNAYD